MSESMVRVIDSEVYEVVKEKLGHEETTGLIFFKLHLVC